jgi:hypothetical protein
VITHSGGCHCGWGRFEVIAPKDMRVSECNLFHMPQGELPASCRSGGAIQTALGQRGAQDLQLQYSHSEAPVLFRVRHKIVLCAALTPGWLQRQCALHRLRNDWRIDCYAVQWPRMGSAVPERSRGV